MLKPSLETRVVDGVLVAEFWDCLRLDPAPVQELRTHFESHLKARGRPEVVVDLSGVGFAGSAALGNFVALHRLARQNGGRLVLCNVDPTVLEVLRGSKLEALFDFATDRSAALAAVNEQATGGAPERASPGENRVGPERPQRPGRRGGGPLRRRNSDQGGS
jgi:anti-anti-sigma factor